MDPRKALSKGFRTSAVPRGESTNEHYLSVRSMEGLCPPNRHFFAAIKDLSRTPVRPETTVTSREKRTSGLPRASEYAYFVNMTTPDETLRFSDNYFDLESGESCTIMAASEQGKLVPETITVGWR